MMGHILRARRTLSPVSIHVVQEQLLAVTWPAFVGQRVVLDVFDSFFLMMNKPNDSWLMFKKLLYSRAKWVIVTDGYRQELLASFIKPRSVVIPNVPFKTNVSTIPRKLSDTVTLAYFGSLAENRGTAFVRAVLEANPDFRVFCAGWPADDASRRLMEHPSVTYLGVLRQAEANEIIAREVDYIVSIYPTDNLNNYYASPNKLYDAIHTRTPLIIGDNVKVSEFVAEKRLGIVITESLLADPKSLGALLLANRHSFDIDKALIERYSWENFEDELIRVHR